MPIFKAGKHFGSIKQFYGRDKRRKLEQVYETLPKH